MTLVDRERLGLSTGTVEGNHQEAAEAFARRVLLGHLPEVGDRFEVMAGREPLLLPSFERHQAELLEPRSFCTDVHHIRQVGQRLSSPKSEPGLVLVSRDQPLEPSGVGCIVRHVDRIAAAGGHEHVGAEHLAQLGDVLLQRDGRCRRRVTAPDVVDQRTEPDHVPGLQEQAYQDTALSRSADGQGRAVPEYLNRTEDAEVQTHSKVLRDVPPSRFPVGWKRPLPWSR